MSNRIKRITEPLNLILEKSNPLKESDLGIQFPSRGGLLHKERVTGWQRMFFIISFQWFTAYFSSLKVRHQAMEEIIRKLGLSEEKLSQLDLEKILYLKAMLPYLVQHEAINRIIHSLNKDAKKTLQVIKVLYITRQFLKIAQEQQEVVEKWMINTASSQWVINFVLLIRQIASKNPRANQTANELKIAEGMIDEVKEVIERLRHYPIEKG